MDSFERPPTPRAKKTFGRLTFEDRTFSCLDCNIAFIYKADYLDHVARVHDPEESERHHLCWSCGQLFATFVQLNEHVLLHDLAALVEGIDELDKRNARKHRRSLGSSTVADSGPNNILPSTSAAQQESSAEKPPEAQTRSKPIKKAKQKKKPVVDSSDKKPLSSGSIGKTKPKPKPTLKAVKVLPDSSATLVQPNAGKRSSGGGGGEGKRRRPSNPVAAATPSAGLQAGLHCPVCNLVMPNSAVMIEHTVAEHSAQIKGIELRAYHGDQLLDGRQVPTGSDSCAFCPSKFSSAPDSLLHLLMRHKHEMLGRFAPAVGDRIVIMLNTSFDGSAVDSNICITCRRK